MIAALFGGDEASTESGGALPDGDDGSIGSDESSERVGDEVDDGLPEINLVEFNIDDAPSKNGDSGALDQDATSTLFASGSNDDKAA